MFCEIIYFYCPKKDKCQRRDLRYDIHRPKKKKNQRKTDTNGTDSKNTEKPVSVNELNNKRQKSFLAITKNN